MGFEQIIALIESGNLIEVPEHPYAKKLKTENPK